MELRLLCADGTPAAGALVSVADAPQPVPDLGRVADDDGRVSLDPPGSGRYSLSVWHEGRARLLTLELAPGMPALELRLPN